MTIETETQFITEGELLPSDFQPTVTGLVCGDPLPPAADIQYTILDGDGQPAANPPVPGLYQVVPQLVDPNQAYGQYAIEAVTGKLYVSPIVDCEHKIKATLVCGQPATLPGEPLITTMYRYQYHNKLDVPIHVPLGPTNRYLTGAYFVGDPPTIFEPGIHSFEVYTDGSFFLWKIKTPNCPEFSKAHSGAFAEPCEDAQALSAPNPFTVNGNFLDNDEDWQVALYPNPARSEVALQTLKMDGQVRVEIFDSIGRRLSGRSYEVREFDQVSLDISDFPSGLLLVKISYDGQSKTRKVLKE